MEVENRTNGTNENLGTVLETVLKLSFEYRIEAIIQYTEKSYLIREKILRKNWPNSRKNIVLSSRE